MSVQRVILDTDIGTDVDDCLALALILASPELELAAVTTVYGDVALRARIVRKLLVLRGARPAPPVAEGAARPLLGRRPVYWAGHEGQGLLEPADDALPAGPGEHAVDLIRRTVMAQPGAVTLIAIGPLTNVALALVQEPRLAESLAGLIVMGGVVGGAYRQRVPWVEHPYSALGLPWTEHNFRSDPEAAQIVLASAASGVGLPLTVVPLDVTSQVRMGAPELARLEARGDPYHRALADQIRRYPRYKSQGWINLHDPLTVTVLIEPSLLRLERLHAVVETQGEHTAGKLLAELTRPDAPATAAIALDVNAEQAERLIVDRLAA